MNEEADIRTELGRLKEYKETIWNDSSDELCINDPPPLQNTGGQHCLEHIPRDGNDLTEEGQMLLEDPELWMDRLTFLWECHESRKRERTTEDDTFLLYNKEVITSTFTGDWLLTEGES